MDGADMDGAGRNGAATAHAGSGEDGIWYLAQLRPNQQERARTNLERQGYRCFLPRRPLTRRRGKRLVQGLGPLFPGYIFLVIEPDRPWGPANATWGVARLVMRAANTPQPVPAAVMADLLARTDADGVLQPAAEPLSPGDAVRITAGPMVEFVAEVERLGDAERVGVLLQMMGQAVRAELPRAHLTRLAG